MKVLFETTQCPKCQKLITRDFNTGPGKWYFCDHCLDYSVHPDQKNNKATTDKLMKLAIIKGE